MEKEKTKNSAEKSDKDKESKEETKKIAVVRIRGSVKLKKEIKDTLNMLRLYKQNNCIILNSTPSILGMLKKVQGYVTWGEIDDQTLELLKKERQEKTKTKKGKETDKKTFRLHPPKKGFERKGIKLPFKVGGALGYRGKKINDLIKRMV